jgi:DNA-binding winged helix-turn-helix (wHTH) protein
MSTMRDASKKDWESAGTIEHLTLGCLQRIADAVERMSVSYSSVVADRNLYERWWKEEKVRNARLHHRIAGLRGALTQKKRTS